MRNQTRCIKRRLREERGRFSSVFGWITGRQERRTKLDKTEHQKRSTRDKRERERRQHCTAHLHNGVHASTGRAASLRFSQRFHFPRFFFFFFFLFVKTPLTRTGSLDYKPHRDEPLVQSNRFETERAKLLKRRNIRSPLPSECCCCWLVWCDTHTHTHRQAK